MARADQLPNWLSALVCTNLQRRKLPGNASPSATAPPPLFLRQPSFLALIVSHEVRQRLSPTHGCGGTSTAVESLCHGNQLDSFLTSLHIHTPDGKDPPHSQTGETKAERVEGSGYCGEGIRYGGVSNWSSVETRDAEEQIKKNGGCVGSLSDQHHKS